MGDYWTWLMSLSYDGVEVSTDGSLVLHGRGTFDYCICSRAIN